MDWDIQFPLLASSSAILPFDFNSSILAVEVVVDNYRPTWERAGYLQSFVNIDGDYFKGDSFKLTFGKVIIQIPYFNYRLEYQPLGWLVNPIIQVKQLTNTQSSNIMPNYAPMPTVLGSQPVLDSLPTSFVAPIYTVAGLPATYQCLAANPTRQTFAVTNNGTAPVFLDLDAPSSAIKRFITIAVNGTYVCDFDYVGAVFVWSSTAATQAVEVRELIQ
jgi:hypothetical protein